MQFGHRQRRHDLLPAGVFAVITAVHSSAIDFKGWAGGVTIL
jgi:hypothetical protein